MKRSDRPSGYKSECKECYYKNYNHKAYSKKYRNSNKGRVTRNIYAEKFRKTEKGKKIRQRCQNKYRKNNQKKIKAEKIIFNAVRYNNIPPAHKLKCFRCGAKARDYHHYLGYDPEHWFDIKPICRICHRIIHNLPVSAQSVQKKELLISQASEKENYSQSK